MSAARTTMITMRSCTHGISTGLSESMPTKTDLDPRRYFPKTDPVFAVGHTHDWQAVILFLDNGTRTDPGNVMNMCYSVNAYDRNYPCKEFKFVWSSLMGSSPLVLYSFTWPTQHRLYPNTPPKDDSKRNNPEAVRKKIGSMQPMIAWEALPDPARSALENTDWGRDNARVPFIDRDNVFRNNLDTAWKHMEAVRGGNRERMASSWR